ncbi:MAG: hypothetical protein OIF32_00590 [Campylobacterales bacterium]|nr:hypothetical protein [Campylobacterales bacterium]
MNDGILIIIPAIVMTGIVGFLVTLAISTKKASDRRKAEEQKEQ